MLDRHVLRFGQSIDFRCWSIRWRFAVGFLNFFQESSPFGNPGHHFSESSLHRRSVGAVDPGFPIGAALFCTSLVMPCSLSKPKTVANDSLIEEMITHQKTVRAYSQEAMVRHVLTS